MSEQRKRLWVLQSVYERLPALFRNQYFLSVVVLAVILLTLLHQSLFSGKGLVPSDGIFQSLPWARTTDGLRSNYLLADQYNTFIPQHQFVHDNLLKGEFPLWNPNQSCGLPNLASLQGALLFPIQLVLSLMHPFSAAGIAAFLKLFLAGLFTILYLRRLGASSIASLVSGIIFSMSGFMIVWLGHPHVNSAMWLPLLLYFIEGEFSVSFLQDRDRAVAFSLRRWVGFAIAYGFMLLGGHPPTAIHITLFVTAYFLFRLTEHGPGKRARLVLLFLSSLSLGILLAAPQLLPFLEYYRLSSSALSSEALHRWGSHLGAANLIHFLLPYASGSPVTGFEDLPRLLGLNGLDNFNERTGYAGVLTLLLASSAVYYRRCKFTIFYLVVALCSMAIIFGIPPLPSIISGLPILQTVNHTRLLMIVVFSLAVLAGLGVDILRKVNRRQILFFIGSFWLITGVLLVWFGSQIWPNLPNLDGPHRAFLFRQLVIPSGAFIVSLVIALGPENKKVWLIGFCCLAWTAGDLLWFATGYNPSITRDRYYPSAPVIEFLKKDTSLFRVMGLGNTLLPNTASVYGLEDIRGVDFMSVKRYEELITGTAGNFFFYRSAQKPPPAFPLLNVKYVITPEPVNGHTDPFELVYSKEVAVYRYKPCLERAFIVFDYKVYRNPDDVLRRVRDKSFDPRNTILLEEEPNSEAGSSPLSEASARIESYKPNEVIIDVSLSRPGFLMLLDTYFPGWKATLNGKPSKIYRADYNFRAVSLPAGRSLVHFSYEPAGLRLGLILFLIATVLLVAAWFRPSRRRSNDLSPDPVER